MAIELEGLRHLAEEIAKNKHIAIRSNTAEKTASTDGRTITIPSYIPDALSPMLTALIAHESAHIQYTGDGQMAYQHITYDSELFGVINLLEDIRIDRKLVRKFPNYTNLMAMYFRLLEDKGRIDYAKIMTGDDFTKTYSAMIYEGNGIRPAMRAPAGLYAHFDAHKNYFLGIIDSVKRAKNVLEVKEFAKMFLFHFKPKWKEYTQEQYEAEQEKQKEKDKKKLDEEMSQWEEEKKRREEYEKNKKKAEDIKDEVDEPELPEPEKPTEPPVDIPAVEEPPPWEGPVWIPPEKPTYNDKGLYEGWQGPPAISQFPIPDRFIPPWEGPEFAEPFEPPPPPPPPPWEEPPPPPPPPPPPGPPEKEKDRKEREKAEKEAREKLVEALHDEILSEALLDGVKLR